MGNLTLNGATSGQITLAPPSVAGTNTLTLPAATGTVLTTAGGQTVSGTTTVSTLNATTVQVGGNQALNGPAFSAYQNASQSVSSSTQTKIQFQAEDFDTANCFDSTTNYRFTPNVAGYYQINLTCRFASANASYEVFVVIKKNGNEWLRGGNSSGQQPSGGFQQCSASAIIYCNGSTDYIEGFLFQSSGSAKNIDATDSLTRFSGCMLRGA